MATYKVTSDRVAGKKRGDIVNVSDLDGFNVDALVDGGHIELARSTKTEKTANESEK